MSAGKLMISRGMPGAARAAPARRESQPRLRAVPAKPEAPGHDEPGRPGSAPLTYHLVHFRLEALERLSRLRDSQALSPQEYEAEKSLVLRLPADSFVEDPIPAGRGPSLLGRLFGWSLILPGIAAGLGFVALTAPQELTGLAQRISSLLA
jgi:hypothetical protein